MVDWQVIEAGYRAGECSVRELARREGITEGAIRKRAKAKGWPARGTRFAGANENRAISEAGTHPGTRFRDQYARVRAREGGTHSNPVEINGPEWAGTPTGSLRAGGLSPSRRPTRPVTAGPRPRLQPTAGSGISRRIASGAMSSLLGRGRSGGLSLRMRA
jgi:hypothetical protein